MAQTRLIGKVVGEDGRPAFISIGSVRTVEPDQPVKINNSGTSANVVLDFEIPKGRAGLPGTNGVNGSPGAQGPQGERGFPGRAATIKISEVEMLPEGSAPEVINVGTEHDADYTLRIPASSATVAEDAFIENSENTVQSKVIQEALAEKADVSSVPTKVSDLENDSSFISSSTVEGMIRDAVDGVVSATNPVDDALSNVSENAVQNKVVSEALENKVSMSLEDIRDDNDSKIGERVTLRDKDNEATFAVSLDLQGQQITGASVVQEYELPAATPETLGGIRVGSGLTISSEGVLSSVVSGKEPVIVAALPSTGDPTKVYLVPVSGDNYSMHLWMDVAGTNKYVTVSGGGEGGSVDLSGYTQKADSIKNITRNGTTFTATRANNSTFTFDQQDTWNANNRTTPGYVAAPGNVANKVWKTDASGNPAWRDDANDNTVYTGTAPITVSGTSIGMSNSGVTAGTYGPNSNVTGNNGITLSVPQITVDAKGRVTNVVNRTYISVAGGAVVREMRGGTIAIPANGSGVYRGYIDVEKQGYTALGIIGVILDQQYIAGTFCVQGNRATVDVHPVVVSNSGRTASVTLFVLYV